MGIHILGLCTVHTVVVTTLYLWWFDCVTPKAKQGQRLPALHACMHGCRILQAYREISNKETVLSTHVNCN